MQRLLGVWMGLGLSLVWGASSARAYTIWAGVTLDVHQDIPNGVLPGGQLPNDFHVEGLICTAQGGVPVLNQHLDDLFPHFSHSLVKLNPLDPTDCWYRFVADWRLLPGQPGIPYCTVVHLGLLFFVADENTMIDLVGWWTLNGVRVGQIYGNLPNGGFVPVVGFSVNPGPIVRIGNGFIPPDDGLLPPLPPPGPLPLPIELIELDVLAVESGALPPNWLEELRPGGAQEFWPWVPVANGAGQDINPANPVPMMPDSFFDVFLEAFGKMDGLAPIAPVVIPPDGLLFVRTRRVFVNNAGVPDPNGGLWEWHIHQAQGSEACCLPNGSCQDLAPADCVARGGFPQGFGTSCATTDCPGTAACCLPSGQCVVTSVSTCLQSGGYPAPGGSCAGDLNGNGTDDACEPPDLGACCHGLSFPQCAVTDALTCTQQLLGEWKGPGSDCRDENGNQAADVCERQPPFCVDADVNCDGVVNAADILSIRAPGTWQQKVPGALTPRADVDHSGGVNAADILMVRAPGTWQSSTGPCRCQ